MGSFPVWKLRITSQWVKQSSPLVCLWLFLAAGDICYIDLTLCGISLESQSFQSPARRNLAKTAGVCRYMSPKQKGLYIYIYVCVKAQVHLQFRAPVERKLLQCCRLRASLMR